MPIRRPWSRYLRLSLRSLLVLILFLGGWLGWSVHTARLQRDAVAAVAAVARGGGFAFYDWQWKDHDWIQGRKWQPPGPRWLVDRIGIDYLSNVTHIIMFRGTSKDLIQVGHLSRLERLQLSGSPVTDIGLAQLEGLGRLQGLFLSDTPISDAGLAHLKSIPNLKALALSDTRITDAGLRHLKGIRSLRELILYDVRVTDAGVADLRRALPKLKIVR